MIKDLFVVKFIDIYEDQIDSEYIDAITKKTMKKLELFEPEDNEIIYIPSHTDIPKTKFKEYIKNKSIRITTDVSKADRLIINNVTSFLEKKTTYSLLYILEKEHLYNFLVAKNMKCLNEFKECYKHPIVGISPNSWQIIKDYLPQDIVLKNYYDYIKYFQDQNLSNNISRLKISLATDVLSQMQADENVIDEEYYLQLTNMFNSSDNDNHVLAMEIMANSNYDKSALYLCLLVMHHNSQIDQARTKRHVNFRGLLNYLNLAPSNLYTNLENIFAFLHSKKLLTLKEVDLVIKHCLSDGMYTNHHSSGSSKLLKSTEIAINNNAVMEVNNGKPYIFRLEP